ncbi:MAG: Ty1/Copia family ribonuclease HI [Fusobacteriaceae bacterium]
MKRKKVNSAAPNNLFRIDEDCERLNQVQATAFHTIVAKALYLVKRARPDASLAIAFLTTRVQAPDADDWKKLEHLIEYFRGTADLPLTLRVDGTGVLSWFVDASFGVHANLRSHTGGGLTMGKGFPIVSSTKQKMNTRSSTESELVGVDDMMSYIIWTRYFLTGQDYKVRDNIIFQDNKSAILLERNGKASSGKRTKHINIRYFFITDRISKGEVRVEWCPTNDMVADYMTKPLQGSAFRRFRDMIMGTL